MKKIRLFWIAVVLLPMLSTSCLKDDMDEGTIILMGSEAYVKPIEEVIPDTLLNFVTSKGLVIPDGNKPVDIQGEFVLYPRHLQWYNVDPVADGDSLFFRFGGDCVIEIDTVSLDPLSIDTLAYYPDGQHNRVVSCDYLEQGFPLMHVDTVFLIGEGNRFVSYFECTYKHMDDFPGADFDLTRSFVMMGEVNEMDQSIENMFVACLNKEVTIHSNNVAESSVPNSYIESMENRIFVYNGDVVRNQWYQWKVQ